MRDDILGRLVKDKVKPASASKNTVLQVGQFTEQSGHGSRGKGCPSPAGPHRSREAGSSPRAAAAPPGAPAPSTLLSHLHV